MIKVFIICIYIHENLYYIFIHLLGFKVITPEKLNEKKNKTSNSFHSSSVLKRTTVNPGSNKSNF